MHGHEHRRVEPADELGFKEIHERPCKRGALFYSITVPYLPVANYCLDLISLPSFTTLLATLQMHERAHVYLHQHV